MGLVVWNPDESSSLISSPVWRIMVDSAVERIRKACSSLPWPLYTVHMSTVPGISKVVST